MQVRFPDVFISAVQPQHVTEASSVTRKNPTRIVHPYVSICERCAKSIVLFLVAYCWLALVLLFLSAVEKR